MNLYLTAALLLGVASQYTLSQPINSDEYYEETGHFFQGTPHGDQSSMCYDVVLSGDPGTPTTAQYLAMFTDKFIEHKGRVFAVKNEMKTGGYEHDYMYEEPNGLYEVVDHAHDPACLTFHLLFEDDHIGQIVASSQFVPYDLIIGVDQETNRIWGYYEEGGVWLRKRTLWGYAKDGSLAVEPIEEGSGKVSAVSGLSLNDRLFNLWGEFPDNFNYAKHDEVHCASKPAIIDDWSGFWSGSRGKYCPGYGDNKLWKYTWPTPNPSKLGWRAATKITRLGPKSNIYGIAPDRTLVHLWDEKDVAVHCVPFKGGLPSTQDVMSLGGLDDGYARGVFVSSRASSEDRVYNLYWDGGWKEVEIVINYKDVWSSSVYFGNYGGKTYLLYINKYPCALVDDLGHKCYALYTEDEHYYELDLYRLDFVGGPVRYEAVLLASNMQYPF